MTREEAIALEESKFWEPLSFHDRAKFQLWEDKLCMPFSVFHEAVEKALGRSVWTHEFGLNREGLRKELLGEAPPPTMAEILGLIAADKLTVLMTHNNESGSE